MGTGLGPFVLRLRRSLANETGQDNVEYGLITALISVGAIVASQNLAGAIRNLFATINAALA